MLYLKQIIDLWLMLPGFKGTKFHMKRDLFNLKHFFIFGCVGSSVPHAGFLQLQQVGSTLRCDAWAPHCSGLFCYGARVLGTQASVVVAHGLGSYGSRALEHRLSNCGTRALVVVACGLQSAGSVVLGHGLSCLAACGIFPDQGSNPCPLHWQEDS